MKTQKNNDNNYVITIHLSHTIYFKGYFSTQSQFHSTIQSIYFQHWLLPELGVTEVIWSLSQVSFGGRQVTLLSQENTVILLLSLIFVA